ncbi:MAG: sodium:solute symporter family protein [marine benthic group bacterium]|nr:sodium:solute symporter family protein [Gemmatimonadota bacterium]
MNAALLLLLAYSVGLVGLGLWIGRRVESSSTFFVAGRTLGPGLLFATLLAANIGAGSTVGAAGLGYRDGLAAWWWVGSAGIGTLALALWVGPSIWRIARERELYTVGDYLEVRYGSSVRAIVAALLWLATLAILAGQLIAAAWVLNVVAGLPKWLGCLAAGGVMTAYFASGGLLTSAWVNLVQLVVLLAGFALALPVALHGAGGWETVVAAAPADNPDWFAFGRSGASGWTWIFLLAPAFIVSPGLLQKVYGARDEVTVRRAGVACAVALLLFAFVPPLLGMTARAIAPDLANPELALPIVLIDGLPLFLGALALAAVFSAEISSADAILFMLATSLSEDLWRRFVRPEATDRQVLRMARLAAFGGGALGIALALALPSVIGALAIFYTLLSVSLFVPLIAGLYSRRPGSVSALAAIAAGVLTVLIAKVAAIPSSGLYSPYVLGLAASALAYGFVSFVEPAIRRSRTRSSRPRGGPPPPGPPPRGRR